MLTTEHLIEETRRFAPQLLRRAADAEAAERLPRTTIEWLRRLQIPRILDSSGSTAIEGRLVILATIARLLGSTCLSTGWVAALYALHFWLIRRFDPGVLAMALSVAESPLIAAAFQPQGSARPTAGGFAVSGRWEWVSGIHDADFVLLNALVGLSGARRFFFVRRADIEISAGTNLIGLKATGTHTVVARDVFVPIWCSLDEDLLRSETPVAGDDDSGLRGHSIQPVLATVGASIAVGAAAAAADWLTRFLRRRRSQLSEPDRVLADLGLGEVIKSAVVARALWERDLGHLGQLPAAARRDQYRTREQFRLSASEIVHRAWCAADMATQLVGTSEGLAFKTLERMHRDLRALRSHFVYRSNAATEAAGASLLCCQGRSHWRKRLRGALDA